MATLNGKAYTELSNAESSSGALDKAEEGDTVYLVGDANLTTAIGEGVTPEVFKDKMPPTAPSCSPERAPSASTPAAQ